MPKRGKRNGNRKAFVRVLPPSLENIPHIRKTMRYQGAVGNAVITSSCLLSVLAASSTNATARVFPVRAIKLKKVELWALDSGTTVNHVLNLRYPAPITTVGSTTTSTSSSSPTKEITATGNATFPAHIMSKPPRESFASQWIGLNNTVAAGANNPVVFGIISNVEYVADITFDAVLFGTNDALNASVRTGVAGAAGVGVDYPHLDSLASDTTNPGTQFLTPDGLLLCTLASASS